MGLVATPSIRCIQLDRSHKFAALMCDGISDVMRNEEVVFELDFVRDASDPVANIRTTCGALVQEAYKRGSDDNLTVILVQFDWETDTTGGSMNIQQPNDASLKKRRLL